MAGWRAGSPRAWAACGGIAGAQPPTRSRAPDPMDGEVCTPRDTDQTLLDHLFGQGETRYTEEQVIALREAHGQVLPHLSVKAQLAQIKRARKKIAAARAAGLNTEKAAKTLAAQEEMLEASTSLQSLTDRHLLDQSG